jgi:hypothetical protein
VKKARKVFLIVFGLGSLAILIAGIFYLTLDEPPPADDDLQPAKVEVPANENGFPVVNIGLDEVFRGDDAWDKYVPFQPAWDFMAAMEMVRRNEEALEKYDRSLEYPRFQVTDITSFEDKIPYISAWNRLVDVALIRPGLLFERGLEKEAFGEAMKVIRFGHSVTGSHGSLVIYSTGLSIQGRGLECMMKMLARTRLPAEEVSPFFEALDHYRPDRASFADVMKREYSCLRLIFEGLGRGDLDVIPDKFLRSHLKKISGGLLRIAFKPNETRRLFADVYHSFIRDFLDGKIDFEKTYALPVHPWLPPRNMIGKTLYQFACAPINSSLHGRALGADLMISSARIEFALWCFNKKRGYLPEALEDLMPEYLKEIPLDPFDGKPLRYSKESKIIYSKEAVDHQLEPAVKIEF